MSGVRNRRAAGRIQVSIILIISAAVALFILWAALFEIDEVAIGQGRIIPSSQTQLVQSVQGGRVIELLVAEGDVVKEGQLLAILDTTSIQAEADEIRVGLEDAQAQKRLLQSLLSDAEELVLSKDLRDNEELVRQKNALFSEIRSTQLQTVVDIELEIDLLNKELEIIDRALNLGGGTQIEKIRIQQKLASARSRLNTQKTNFKSDTQIELDEVNRIVQQSRIRLIAQKELLLGSELRSPRLGVVQKVFVSTAGGGVLPPNGTVMEIVPIEERLLIEARFSPRDIAFIAPAQLARIKVTAYDFAIYGDLEAKVLRVSPDSFQDEANDGAYYFAVTLESERTYFEPAPGQTFPIIPGMITTTEVLTGKRTILQYLLKPLRRASEALRER